MASRAPPIESRDVVRGVGWIVGSRTWMDVHGLSVQHWGDVSRGRRPLVRRNESTVQVRCVIVPERRQTGCITVPYKIAEPIIKTSGQPWRQRITFLRREMIFLRRVGEQSLIPESGKATFLSDSMYARFLLVRSLA